MTQSEQLITGSIRIFFGETFTGSVILLALCIFTGIIFQAQNRNSPNLLNLNGLVCAYGLALFLALPLTLVNLIKKAGSSYPNFLGITVWIILIVLCLCFMHIREQGRAEKEEADNFCQASANEIFTGISLFLRLNNLPETKINMAEYCSFKKIKEIQMYVTTFSCSDADRVKKITESFSQMSENNREKVLTILKRSVSEI